MKTKTCKWCGKRATHITSQGVFVCDLCNGNPALSKWKLVSKHSRIVAASDDDVFIVGTQSPKWRGGGA